MRLIVDYDVKTDPNTILYWRRCARRRRNRSCRRM